MRRMSSLPTSPVPASPREPSPRARPPRDSWLRRFLEGQGATDGHAHHTHPWWQVLWLTGVDYFSTLGYQPGIAFLAAGVLSPIATLLLVIVTLVGALPIYALVARYSYIGQGSIAMLERIVHGWRGKLVVLVLLGFAATDFVITMTLSAADAAQHAIENPLLHDFLGDSRLLTTCILLAALAAVFLRGFREAIGLAVVIGVPYMILSLIIGVRGVIELSAHPEHLAKWTSDIAIRGDWTALLLASALIFPKLALGLSGFETGASVMPLIESDDPPNQVPHQRIRATRKMLITAAVMMSVMLLISSVVTTLLIPAADFAPGGKANGRALAYLAHKLLGNVFGTVYDVSTILILWFAGASAMAGLLNVIPRYLPRFGMAPKWTAHQRPLILVLFVITILVTLVFNADVDAQGGAYATGVLALILSASVAVALVLWKEARHPTDGRPKRFPLGSLYFWLISAVFTFTFIDNVIARPDGVIISAIFIFIVLTISALSRFRRAMEMRVERYTFADESSERVWQKIKGKKVNFVPIAFYDPVHLTNKEWRIRSFYNVGDVEIAYLLVKLVDDRSEFSTHLSIQAEPLEEGGYLVTVHGAVAVANTIAWVSEELDPISIFLTLTRKNTMTQSLKYLLWGEGEIGILVYNILVRYWESTHEDDVRPRIFLLSE